MTGVEAARFFFALVGAALLAGVIWFAGPLVDIDGWQPLGDDAVRIVVMIVIVLLVIAAHVGGMVLRQLRHRRLAGALAGSADTRMGGRDLADLRDRFSEAMAAVAKGSGGKQRLTEMPWYLMIGPPGSGKTTAILRSGLGFPLAESFGQRTVEGVGGTRNCDWLITDEAVLIDTAGRYTTQDSERGADRAEWLAFLDLLRRHRGRRALNGVVVAIGLAELATADRDESARHASAIGRRINELQLKLGARLPIYLLFTKADLISGFVEYFDRMNREEREQVWGVTFGYDDGSGDSDVVAEYPAAFDELVQRVVEQQLDRMQAEKDAARRALIFDFPSQFRSVRDRTARFLSDTFKASRFRTPPLLRGVYFSSGTQEGTPIDRLLGIMGQAFGITSSATHAHSGTGHSYFLTRLLRDVVFPEANLVYLRPGQRPAMRGVYRLGAAAACLLAVLGIVLLLLAYQGNRQLVAAVASDAEDRPDATSLQGLSPLKAPQFQAILPVLDDRASLAQQVAQRDEGLMAAARWSFFQGPILAGAAESAYERALVDLLLPNLQVTMEQQMRGALRDPATLGNLLPIYEMLVGAAQVDPARIKSWLGDASAATGADIPMDKLAPHLEALLGYRPWPAGAADDALVTRVQKVIGGDAGGSASGGDDGSGTDASSATVPRYRSTL